MTNAALRTKIRQLDFPTPHICSRNAAEFLKKDDENRAIVN
jgi:hypothetical protein